MLSPETGFLKIPLLKILITWINYPKLVVFFKSEFRT